MNGPEHYAEAERLLEEMDYSTSADTLAAAQVHATLALAAATALGVLDRGFDCPDATGPEAGGWNEVLG